MKKNNYELNHYILKGGKVKIVPLMTWAKWFENPKSPGRITEQTMIGDVKVSTVFLGLDHSFGRGAKPLLWETMIFSKKHKAFRDYQVRYFSLKDAKAGHKDAVKFVKYLLNK